MNNVCEFDKMNLKETIKLAVTMHTNSSKLQAEIIAQDMSYEKMVGKGRAIELTKRSGVYETNRGSLQNGSISS